MKILLIEDDQTFLERIKQCILKELPDTEFEDCFMVELALEMASHEYDCIILDLWLPRSTGIESLRPIIKTFKKTPVIVLTGSESEDLALQTITEGAQDYLLKDRLDPKLLKRTIRYSIARKHSDLRMTGDTL